jgi:hypothetical protein
MAQITCRRLIALAAAYVVALQMILSGLWMAVAAGELAQPHCVTASHDTGPGTLPERLDCAGCPVLCGGMGLAGPAPWIVANLVPMPLGRRGTAVAQVTAVGATRNLPPSRAPPGELDFHV